MFYAGQKVVCVNDGKDPWSHPLARWDRGEEVVKGRIYTVVRCFRDFAGELVLDLAEVSRSPRARADIDHNIGYGVWRFRPVAERKTSIEVFRKLLNPTPERVTEDA